VKKPTYKIFLRKVTTALEQVLISCPNHEKKQSRSD